LTSCNNDPLNNGRSDVNGPGVIMDNAKEIEEMNRITNKIAGSPSKQQLENEDSTPEQPQPDGHHGAVC
jgi:hypothetical protein